MAEAPQRLIQYAIYENPRDYPQGFIVREWYINRDGTLQPGQAYAAATLDDAHALLRDGATQIGGRDPNDPAIIELWL
jgi:hypothetical protein